MQYKIIDKLLSKTARRDYFKVLLGDKTSGKYVKTITVPEKEYKKCKIKGTYDER